MEEIEEKLKEKLKNYIDKYLKDENLVCNELTVRESAKCASIAYEHQPRVCSVNLSDKPIDIFIKENEDLNDFQTVLFRMIKERNLNDSEVYNKVHLDRRLFSKIRSDKNYHPSKETVILLGLSLELRVKELEELLDSAAYSLPRNNYYDLIIRFCFLNRIYDIISVNELLDEYSCKLFNY